MWSPPLEEISISLIILVILDEKSRQTQLANVIRSYTYYYNIANVMGDRIHYPANSDKKKVFGGIIFSCCGCDEPFFGKLNADSSPFLENFPGVTLSGSFYGGEIGCGDSSSYCGEAQQEGSYRCCVHSYNSVYLVMSYTPPSPRL